MYIRHSFPCYYSIENNSFNKIMDKFKKIIDSILNLILPKDLEILEIENISETDLLNKIPVANEIENCKHIALFQYKNKLLKKAIWAIKYNKNQKIITKFSNLLYEFIIENIAEQMTFSAFNNPVLIPIPMHKDNLNERGYNQSDLIVREIYKIDEGENFDVSLNALIKIKKTPHQSKLKNKIERLKNLKNCFYADEKLVMGKNIILIDDVITTGTTMNEAAKALKNAGAKNVIGFSIAH